MTKRRKTIRIFKGLFIIIVSVAIIFIAAIYFANLAINKTTQNYVWDNFDEIPECRAALVLGTAKYLRGGDVNLYFKYRIDSAAELYKSGKVEFIVVSGDNSRQNYNEPLDMKNALIDKGVPGNVIFLDYAGFRTLDSVIRMKEIFSQEKFIVVSQKFHNQRSVFIAHRYGLEAYGYNARDVGDYLGVKTNMREKFARVKVFIDLITNKQPKFFGEKIVLEKDKTNDLE